MNTIIKEKTCNFEVGDKCIFCQTPMLQPNEVKIPKYLGDTNRGSCCTECSNEIASAFSQLRDIQDEKIFIINNLMGKFSNPQYKND
jgi:hypothetical protein